MKKIISICFMFFVFIFGLGFVSATTDSINVSVTEDAYVYNNSADTNYGNVANLFVRDNSTPERYDTYLEYLINDIPDGQIIDNAELCIYTNLINNSGKNVTIYLLSEIFVENIIKWSSNYRQYILYNYNKSYEFNSSNVDKYTCIDIIDLVSYAYSQNETFLDLVIVGADANNGTVRFSSKEGSYPTYLTVGHTSDYSNWCQYNAFKGGTVTTCNTFYSGNICDKAFNAVKDVADSEWIGNPDDEIPPFIAHTITNVDEPFYFDRVEIWQRVNYDFPNGVGMEAFEISVYSPDTDTWYLLINRSEGHTSKEGAVSNFFFGGNVDSGGSGYTMLPYLKNIDTIYLGNLSISKVQLKVYKTLADVATHIILRELAFCVMEESESVLANVTDYAGAGLGVGCDTDADCECQLCEYGFCVLRRTNMNCIINGTSRDDCCLSGTCSGGKCTKESLWTGLEASKNQQFGDDTMTNNFISLFIIIGIAGFLMFYGNVIGGVFALYILSIFFVIAGWLSPFILIGMILTGLIALVFKVMMGQGIE